MDVDGYLATIVSTADYSPFGVQLDERTVSAESYRFGYQGSEKDDEVKGSGNSYTTEFRQLDVRLGRWLSLDPLAAEFPWQSPYCSMDDEPIGLNDENGQAAYGKGGGGGGGRGGGNGRNGRNGVPRSERDGGMRHIGMRNELVRTQESLRKMKQGSGGGGNGNSRPRSVSITTAPDAFLPNSMPLSTINGTTFSHHPASGLTTSTRITTSASSHVPGGVRPTPEFLAEGVEFLKALGNEYINSLTSVSVSSVTANVGRGDGTVNYYTFNHQLHFTNPDECKLFIAAQGAWEAIYDDELSKALKNAPQNTNPIMPLIDHGRTAYFRTVLQVGESPANKILKSLEKGTSNGSVKVISTDIYRAEVGRKR